MPSPRTHAARTPAEVSFAPGEPVYEVVAVRYATRETTKAACYFGWHVYGEPDEPYRMDYFFWVLRGGGRTVVVDTGYDVAVGERRGRTTLCAPVEALARLGVDPASVDDLVITHLHYDHVGNVGAFPAARLSVQRRELDFWTAPIAAKPQFAPLVERPEVERVAATVRDGHGRVVDGNGPLLPGIVAFDVGGHSPGQQVTVVNAAAGPVILASDAIHYYEELELDRPFEVVVDLAEMYEGYDLLRELAELPGAVLVPGHDPAVAERFPALDGHPAELAVRVA